MDAPYGGIHKRRTHARGEGEFAKSVRKVYKGGGGVFELCTYTYLKTRTHQIFFIRKKSIQILRKNRGKKSQSRLQIRKNRIFDFLNSGGGHGQHRVSEIEIFFTPKMLHICVLHVDFKQNNI